MLYRTHGTVVKRRLGNDVRLSPFLGRTQLPPSGMNVGCSFSSQTNESRGSRPWQQKSNPQKRPSSENNLESRTNAILRLRPGRLDYNGWKQAKGMLDTLTKRSSLKTAIKAEELLERLVEETTVNKQPFVRLTPTMYNQCMNAYARSGATDGAVRANAILERMQSRYEENPTVAPEPDTISFNTLLHSWAKSDDEQATERAEELIHTMEERFRANPDGAVVPTTWSYNLIILAHANRAYEQYGSAKAAEDWLLRMSELNLEDGPDTISFNTVLVAWASSQDEKGPDRALEILNLQIKLCNQGHNVTPDESSFSIVISAFARRGQAQKAQEVLYLTREVNFPQGTDITSCYNCVIDAWSKSGAIDAGYMAETVLNNAQSHSESTDSNVVVSPNVISYTSCLDAHTKADHPQALENAEDFLWRIIDSYRLGEWELGPTTKTFICLINAWAKSGRENGAVKAESWLNIMQDLARTESFKCRPNTMAYNICLDAWAHSDAPNATARALKVLRRMEEAFKKGDKHARPAGFSYRIVIKKLLSSGEKKDALEALSLVLTMNEQARQGNKDTLPDTATCNKVIFRLTQTRDEEAIKAALNLIRWMDRASQDGLWCVRPDTWTFTTVMRALSQLPHNEAKIAAIELFDRMKELDAVENNGVNLNVTAAYIVLTTLSNLVDKERAANKACSVVGELWRMNDESGNDTLLDAKCLATCLQTVLRVETLEYTMKAHELLKQMMRRYRDGSSTYMPLRAGFESMIGALSKSGGEALVERINEILDLVDDIPFDEYFHKGPGAIFYSKVISVLVEREKMEDAERVLFSWEHKCRLYEDIERPNVIIWNKLIHAWSKSSSGDKVLRAKGLLDRLKTTANECTGAPVPDITSFNTVLNAASFAGSDNHVRQEALGIAMSLYDELKNKQLHLQMDEVTYGTMLKAVGRLMNRGSDKTDLVRVIFKECCANGQDGPMVMKEIQQQLSHTEIQEIRDNSNSPIRRSKRFVTTRTPRDSSSASFFREAC